MLKVTSKKDRIVFHKKKGAKLHDPSKYTEWLIKLSEAFDAEIIRLHYYFCSDEEVLELNRAHLNHDYYTDILTFGYGTAKQIEGEVFLSTDRITENASSLGLEYEEELIRVMAHGLLHLLGYDDHEEEDIKRIRELEDKAIELFHVKH